MERDREGQRQRVIHRKIERERLRVEDRERLREREREREKGIVQNWKLLGHMN